MHFSTHYSTHWLHLFTFSFFLLLFLLVQSHSISLYQAIFHLLDDGFLTQTKSVVFHSFSFKVVSSYQKDCKDLKVHRNKCKSPKNCLSKRTKQCTLYSLLPSRIQHFKQTSALSAAALQYGNRTTKATLWVTKRELSLLFSLCTVWSIVVW